MPTVLKNTPIGLMLPIRSGPKSGYFDQSFDSFTAYRMNIINLIRTIPGERRMSPTFGCGLWNVVFEQNDDFIPEKIQKIIKDDIAQWIPGVSVASVDVRYYDPNAGQTDTYKLYIKVTYVVDVINQADVVEIILNPTKV